MRAIKQIFVGIGATAVSLAAVSPAVAAGSSSATTSMVSATVTAGDIQFDGGDCVTFPVTASFTKTATPLDDVYATVRMEMRQPGSNSSDSVSLYYGYSEPASGSKTEGIFICPSSYNPAAGNFTMTGTLKGEYYVDGSEQTVTFAPIQVGAIQNPTTIGTMKFKKQSGNFYEVSGTATAAAPTKGTVGAGGKLTISVKKPGSKRWVAGATAYADSFGQWSSYLGKQAKGTQVKVDLADCGWCTNATRTAKITK